MRPIDYIASMLVELVWSTDEITLLFEQAVHRAGFAMLNNIYRRRNRIYIYIYDIWGKRLLNDI